MKMNLIPLCAIACSTLLSASAFSDTLTGKIIYKAKDDNLVLKSATVEIDPEKAQEIKLKLKDQAEELSQKVRVKKFETEERTIVVAAFRNVRNLPEGTSLFIKANLLSGKNGKVMYGDVFTRTCGKGFAAETSDQDGALERVIYNIRERRGCELTYRGGILFSTVQTETESEG